MAWHDPTVGSGSIFFEKLYAALDGRATSRPIVTFYDLVAYLQREVRFATDASQHPMPGDLSPHGSLGSFFFFNRRPLVEDHILPDWDATKVKPFGAPLALWTAASKNDLGLKVCNATTSQIGVALGYKDRDGWVSEGWWNVDSQSCAFLVQDRLRSRFFYVYAFDYDKGGEWGGSINMCTNDVEFTIKGFDNCEGRGFKKSGFFEVDTQEKEGWIVKLTEQTEPAPSQADNAAN